MRKILKKIIFPVFKFSLDNYYKKPRKYVYENIEVLVYPQVFPPHFTISTKILLKYIKPLDLKDKSLLELGCGSGIISLFAASKKAHVMASDINQVAIDALRVASIKNDLKVSVLYSDMFDQLDKQSFDYIIINPPYYPKAPQNEKERAWFCGAHFEYFEKLFLQLPKYLAVNTLMILSEDCNIERIKQIAIKNNLALVCILEKSIVGETNFIFNIQHYEKSI